jgi:hypothetical protein
MRNNFVAAICLACWLIMAVFPVSGYNSLNEAAEAALPLSIPALEGVQVDFSEENLLKYGNNDDGISPNLTNIDPSISGSVDYSDPNCQSDLRIVDYWGNHYSCNADCVFLDGISRMIVAPCKRGWLKLYEEYPDGNVVESRHIPVFADREYNWWFIGDTEGLHTMWFTIIDHLGQVSQSNEVTYRVLLKDCPEVANCSPSSRYV